MKLNYLLWREPVTSRRAFLKTGPPLRWLPARPSARAAGSCPFLGANLRLHRATLRLAGANLLEPDSESLPDIHVPLS